jgi:hypothetical protein
MKKQKDESRPLSYESDGKMGKSKNQQDNKKEQKDFFNVTQDSE